MRSFAHLAVGLAVGLSLIPLSLLVEDPAAPARLLILLGVAATLGAALAALGVSRLLVLLAQAAGLAGVLYWEGLGLMGTGHQAGFTWLVTDGMAAIRTGAAPVAGTPGLTWLVLVLAAVLTIAAEVLANALEQPAWTIVPLVVTFGTASLLIRPDLPWLHALPVVAGYVLVLLAATPVGRDAAGRLSRRRQFQASRAVTGLAMGGLAAVLAFVLALAVPIGDPRTWGDEGPDGPIQLGDPTVQLDRDLRRPADSKVLTYTSSDGRPLYLRTVALPLLTTGGAKLVPMELHRSGLDRAHDFPGERVETTVTMSASSEYLPAPFAPTEVRAEGTWSYDLQTLSIVATGKDRANQTIGLDYRVVSNVPSATRATIAAAGAGSGADPMTVEVPDGLDERVRQLTAEVTAETTTAGEAALEIQRFLRSEAFDYSFSAPASTGMDALSAFLLDSRKGYCIHFAGAMVTMARIEGIPARMAIGFTPGDLQDDGSYEVTAHDAHSWPELYLDGLGWVPFEPTPAYAGNPAVTDPAGPRPTDTPSATPSATPTGEPSEQPTAAPTLTPTAPTTPTPGGATDSGTPLGWLLPLLLLLALCAAPAVLRVLLRRSRLRHGQPADAAADAAWREVRALFADYRLTWPDGSPGPAAAAAAPSLPAQGAAALGAVADTVERSRYARDETGTAQVAAQVKALRVAVDRAAEPRTRLLARVLPLSLLSRVVPGIAVRHRMSGK
ncbi:MAG: transglutaminase domain-containing protein [Tessaracoccus sp.]|uniref:transglutaminase family protein n=1 Tax=Tessaracoccus sp. TaxID=1971211 RepID=UPI001EB7FEFA|nr:DUF3488 and transglutaminase-like domain-containing protein [Tessaracoccus sp.]MBK7821578.1 transglutaminase domain-containing protein [Tessaracoccus sp.]